jgi:hypothetical protein
VRRSPLPLCSAIPREAYAPRSCAAMRTSSGERRFLRCTNADPTKSGGCQPAVVRQTRLRRHQRDCSQDRREYVPRSPLPSCAAIPRGLTPPALVLQCERLPAKKRYLRCTDAHPTRSGGCQPAVGCIVPRGQCTASNVRRVTTVQPGAAGVSPPWFGFALATATAYFRLSAFVRHDRFPHHGGLTPPLLCCNANVRRRKTIFSMHKRTSDQERRTSARRGSANTFTQTPARFLARPPRVCAPITLAIVCSDTTGGSRPPLLCCDANVCRRKNDFFDAQTQIRPRAANVSPPWVALRRADNAQRVTSGE